MNTAKVVWNEDKSAALKNIKRAEYILNHYARSDVISLARDLDRYEMNLLTDQDLDRLVKEAESLKHMEQYIVGLIDGFNRARFILEKAHK